VPRDSAVFLEDIAQACAKISRYTTAMTLDTFRQDDRTVDAVVRNLEVIGEAVKRLPEDIRSQIPGIDWKRVAGLRDLLIHQYFGVDLEIVWEICQEKVPTLEAAVSSFLSGT
jgi:uncharacterized protein with HEPN domain